MIEIEACSHTAYSVIDEPQATETESPAWNVADWAPGSVDHPEHTYPDLERYRVAYCSDVLYLSSVSPEVSKLYSGSDA